MASITEMKGVTRANAYRVPAEELEQKEDSRRWSDTEVKDLADDILLRTQLVPILVNKEKDGDGKEHLYVVAGRRRCAAIRYINENGLYKENGVTVPLKVLCLQFTGPSTEVFSAAVVENLKRKDLSPVDLAHCIATLEKQGKTRKEIAKLLGISESLISQTLKLLTLQIGVQRDIHKGHIAASVGYEMAGLSAQDQAKAANAAASQETAPGAESATSEKPKTKPTRESVRQTKREAAERGEETSGPKSRSRKVVYNLFADWAGCEDSTIEVPIRDLCKALVKYMDGKVGDRAVLNQMRELAGE